MRTSPPRMNDARKRAEAKSAACDILLDLMLEDPNFPAERKNGLLVMKAARQIHDAVGALVEAYADPEKEVPCDKAKEVAEYLGLVHTGIKQFIETQNTECTE